MTKEVLIHLKGMQTTDDPHSSDEPLELITVGEYYYRNNTHYLLYEEQMEGLDEPIHNLVKIRPGHMEVRKKDRYRPIWSLRQKNRTWPAIRHHMVRSRWISQRPE